MEKIIEIPEGYKARIEGNKVTKNEDGVLVNLSQLSRVAKKDENQGEQKQNTNCLLSWSEIDEKMLQSLEGIVKDYWAKAEQEKNEIKIREASNVSYFLKTIQKSPLCWIKCSDGLPNRDGTYLVVTDGRHNDVYDMARYDSIDGWHKASEILYWMPIPQFNDKSIIERQPTWSEEDEKMFEFWNLYYEHKVGDMPNKDAVENLEKFRDWLKSLKNRVQPKQEWSEEDEIGFRDAMWAIEQARTIAKDENDMGNLWYAERWLKSLKSLVFGLQEASFASEQDSKGGRRRCVTREIR